MHGRNDEKRLRLLDDDDEKGASSGEIIDYAYVCGICECMAVVKGDMIIGAEKHY